MGAALMNWLAVGSLEWVRLNQYAPRYSLPSLLMLAVAAGIVFAAPMRRRSTSLCAAAWLGVYALALLSYGRPSLDGVKVRLDLRWGAMTFEVVRSGARVVAGEYWTVWPAVFHANYTLHGSGAPQVFGLTYRSAATNDLWLGRGPIPREELRTVRRLREDDVRTLHRLQLGAQGVLLGQNSRNPIVRWLIPRALPLFLRSPLLPRVQRRLFFGAPLPPLDRAFSFREAAAS